MGRFELVRTAKQEKFFLNRTQKQKKCIEENQNVTGNGSLAVTREKVERLVITPYQGGVLDYDEKLIQFNSVKTAKI